MIIVQRAQWFQTDSAVNGFDSIVRVFFSRTYRTNSRDSLSVLVGPCKEIVERRGE